MFELWKNELKTRQAIRNKLEEIKSSYNNYKKLIKQYNWSDSVVSNNIKQYKKAIASFEEALKDY